MIYWWVAELLKRAGRTRYWLAKVTGLPASTVYRVSRPGVAVERIDARISSCTFRPSGEAGMMRQWPVVASFPRLALSTAV